jgi:hypothetical protein
MKETWNVMPQTIFREKTSMDIWREILGKRIQDYKEKRRIADEIGILSLRTLDRWVDGTSTPKNSQLIWGLDRSVSSFQPEMREALRIAFPDVFKSTNPLPHQGQIIEGEIPQEFLWRVLHASTTLPSSMRQWTVTNLVLEQMVHHIDPDILGIAVIFAQCVPDNSPNKKVHYLLLENGVGSGLWDTRQLVSQHKCELRVKEKSKSPISAAITDRRPQIIQLLTDFYSPPELSFFLQHAKIEAVAAYPVQRMEALAGALVIWASVQDFFTSTRRKLIDQYVQLYSLGFSDHLFYTQIALEE